MYNNYILLQTISSFNLSAVSLHLDCWIRDLPVNDTVPAGVHVPHCPADCVDSQPQAHRHKQSDQEDGGEHIGATLCNTGNVDVECGTKVYCGPLLLIITLNQGCSIMKL